MSTFCASCGTALRSGAVFCPQCGIKAAAAVPEVRGPTRRKAPLAMALLIISLMVSGLGLFFFRPELFDRREGFEDIRLGMSVAELELRGFRCQPDGPDCYPLIDAQLSKANPVKGEAAYAKCIACHTNYAGGGDGIGPNLWGVVGSPIGTNRQGFDYSQALKETRGHWDVTNLNAYLVSPKQFIDETKMSFGGLSDPVQRADLIAYLNTLRNEPMSLSEFIEFDRTSKKKYSTRSYSLFDVQATVLAAIYSDGTVGDVSVASRIAPRELHKLLSDKYGPARSFVEWRDEAFDGSQITALTWLYWQTGSGLTILSNTDGSRQPLDIRPENWQFGVSPPERHTWVQYLGVQASRLVSERAKRGEIRLANLARPSGPAVVTALASENGEFSPTISAADAATVQSTTKADAIAAANAAELEANLRADAQIDAEAAASIAERAADETNRR